MGEPNTILRFLARHQPDDASSRVRPNAGGPLPHSGECGSDGGPTLSVRLPPSVPKTVAALLRWGRKSGQRTFCIGRGGKIRPVSFSSPTSSPFRCLFHFTERSEIIHAVPFSFLAKNVPIFIFPIFRCVKRPHFPSPFSPIFLHRLKKGTFSRRTTSPCSQLSFYHLVFWFFFQ
jgi:hypothetical protein